MEIKEITKEDAFKIIETREPEGLFWFFDENNMFIAIDNSRGEAIVEEFYNKEECLQWLKDWFKKPGDEELYGNRKVCYNLLANSIHETMDEKENGIMDSNTCFKEMQKVSELICNMMNAGANTEEMKRVIDYSIVVMDTFKYELQLDKTMIDNGIVELEKKYMKEV